MPKVERDNLKRQLDSINDADDSPMELAVRVMPNLKTEIAAAAEPRLNPSANGTNTDGMMETV
jgi:hypothetical protein